MRQPGEGRGRAAALLAACFWAGACWPEDDPVVIIEWVDAEPATDEGAEPPPPPPPPPPPAADADAGAPWTGPEAAGGDAGADGDSGWAPEVVPGADAGAEAGPGTCACDVTSSCDYECSCDRDCPCSCDTTWWCSAGCGCDPECDPHWGSCEPDGICNSWCPAAAADSDCGGSDPGPAPGPAPDPGSCGGAVSFVTWPEQHTESGTDWGAALTDVLRHLPASYGTYYRDSDLITSAHETTHGIHSHLRGALAGWSGNAFYVMENRALTMPEPGCRKSDVAAYVPASLRGSRYSLYILGMTDWDDTPTYVFDEWVAYTNGGAVGVDLVRSGLWRYGWRDGVMGQLEFTVYALALGMAVEARDPAYWARETQFREFIRWHACRAMAIFREGAAMSAFAWDAQDAYERNLREAADAEPLRAWVRRVYGADWAREVFGF
ncbi:MAG: hypothetical protein GYA57_18045 [Myxococcales bacterium]|nr:hypothetical protein [Myxococcales bacterium]